MYMNVLSVCPCMHCPWELQKAITTSPSLKPELQTTIKNQTLATSTAPFLIILNILNSFDRKTNHLLNSTSWRKIGSVINVLSSSILPPYFLTITPF